MKLLTTFLSLSLLPAFLLSAAPKIEQGQSFEQVTRILGSPIGTLQLGAKTILMYPQGDITFLADKVSDIDLMSDDEFTAEQERKRLEHEEWQMQQAQLAAARLEKGTRLKAEKLKSSAFTALPAKKKVDYWRSFQIRYPEVDVTEQVAKALEAYQTELAALETEKRIAELEARIARAEQAVAEAERENERLRNQSSRIDLYNSGHSCTTRSYRIDYPQRKIIIHSGNNTVVTRPSSSCSNYRRNNRKAFVSRRSESTAERTSRILKSTYKR